MKQVSSSLNIIIKIELAQRTWSVGLSQQLHCQWIASTFLKHAISANLPNYSFNSGTFRNNALDIIEIAVVKRLSFLQYLKHLPSLIKSTRCIYWIVFDVLFLASMGLCRTWEEIECSRHRRTRVLYPTFMQTWPYGSLAYPGYRSHPLVLSLRTQLKKVLSSQNHAASVGYGYELKFSFAWRVGPTGSTRSQCERSRWDLCKSVNTSKDRRGPDNIT